MILSIEIDGILFRYNKTGSYLADYIARDGGSYAIYIDEIRAGRIIPPQNKDVVLEWEKYSELYKKALLKAENLLILL